MGFTPQQVNIMSLWQFFSALHGFIDANTPKGSAKLTESEADDLFDWIERDTGGPRMLTTQTYWWDEHGPQLGRIVTFAVH